MSDSKQPVAYITPDSQGRTIFISAYPSHHELWEKNSVEVAGPYGSRHTHVESMTGIIRNILEQIGCDVTIEEDMNP